VGKYVKAGRSLWACLWPGCGRVCDRVCGRVVAGCWGSSPSSVKAWLWVGLWPGCGWVCGRVVAGFVAGFVAEYVILLYRGSLFGPVGQKNETA
jgi:hypothetical protein